MQEAYRQRLFLLDHNLRPDKTIANIAITLNHQTDSLLRKLIDHLKTEFLTHGGIKEEMYAARKEWRRQNQ